MNKQTLITRYLHGQPLTRDERAALARQLKGAHNASRAIKLAREEAAAACHDWQPAKPCVGWVAICYVKYVQIWRVMRDGEIVSAHNNETEARRAGARLAADVNAQWRGLVVDPRRDAVKHCETSTFSRGTSEEVTRIQLQDGSFTILDGNDYPALGKHLWQLSAHGYVIRTELVDGHDKTVLMHREIMKPPDDMEIDHINGDRLDNRRCNLRVATRQQNAMNQKQQADSTSPYKGVYWRKDAKKWHAQIAVDGRRMFLGYFDAAEEGARAYNEAATKYHGVFARLNEV